jgi:hypothetical protein
MVDVVAGQYGYHVLDHDLDRSLVYQMVDHFVERIVGRTFSDE